MSDGYNGWTNYETWLVNLWLDNDGGSESLRERAESEYETRADFDEYAFGQTIQEYVGEVYLGDFPRTGMIADIINAALSSVNWQEIASHYADDLPETEDEDATG